MIQTGITPEKEKEIPPLREYSPQSLLLFTSSGLTPEKELEIPSLEPVVLHSSRGRRRLTDRFLELAPTVFDFVKSTGYKAAQKRDVTIGRTVGSRLEDIKSNAEASIGALDSVSPMTIAQMFVPPNKRFRVCAYLYY